MKFFEFIQKALSEDNGNPSSTRLNVFFAVLQWAPAVTAGFIIVLLSYPDFILTYLTALLGGLLGLLGLKVYQKGKESDVRSADINGGSSEPTKEEPPK